MDIRQITDTYFVAPQIDPSELSAISAAGIKTVICNRPDSEVPPALQADAMEAAAKAAGLAFHRRPLTHQTMTPDVVAEHMALAQDAEGPVLAYCASGTRSTVAWCLGQAGHMDCDDILRTARQGGYNLDALRPTIEAIAAHKAR